MKRLFLFTLLLAGFVGANAQSDKVTLRLTQYNLSNKSLAIGGYDPVSYFSGKPKKGNAKYTASYQGITYFFTDAQNKEAFLKAPAQYEPQYGGWCAYAMGNDGSKVEVGPETYKILDGKLYLFYNSFFNNTLKSWNKNEAALKNNADKNWTKFYR